MTDKLLNYYDEIGENEFINKYKSTLDKIKSFSYQNDIESLKITLKQFEKISSDLITKYINLIIASNKIDLKSIRDKIHFELKNFVIDKYIKKVVNQDKQIIRQNQEINEIKKMFEKLIFKNYLQEDYNEFTNPTKESQLCPNSPKIEVKKNTQYIKKQVTLSNDINLLKDKNKPKRDTKSVENTRLRLLDIEAERIINEYPSKSNKISQSPIHTEEKFISYSSKSNDIDKTAEKIKKVSYSPNKISRANSKENVNKKDPANKVRNINRFINVSNVNTSLKKNSSYNKLDKPLKTSTNRPVTPSETLSSSSGSKMNEVKKVNSPIHRKNKFNKSLDISRECNKNNLAEELSKSHLDPNKPNTIANKEKNTVNYSKKMLNKYYEMLDNFNKKLKSKDNSTPSNYKEKDSSIDKKGIRNVSTNKKNSSISKQTN